MKFNDMKEQDSVDRDRIVVRRLVLSKKFFQHGLDYSSKLGAFERMLAVNNLHLAIEIMIRTIAYRYDVDGWDWDISIRKLIRNIGDSDEIKERGLALPSTLQIKDLIAWRNLASHAALDPNPGKVQEFRYLTERFLRKTTKSFFGWDFDALSSVQVIDHVELRGLLLQAEKHLQLVEGLLGNSSPDEKAEEAIYNNNQQALAVLAITFGLAYDSLRSNILLAVIEHLMDPPKLAFDESESELELIWDRLREQEVASLCTHLGVDYWTYQELTELVPAVFVDENDDCWLESLNDKKANPKLLRRLIAFEVDLISSWESKSWLEVKLDLDAYDAYSVAAKKYLSGDDLGMIGTDKLAPGTSRMTLGNVIKYGYPFLPSARL